MPWSQPSPREYVQWDEFERYPNFWAGHIIGGLLENEGVPVIVELRRRAEEYREAELAKARARLARGDAPEAVLEALARGLANKFLHHPSQALSRAAEGEREALAHAIEALYPALDERDPSSGS